jgi:uncharacterized protein involved in exopolysaccharide biosynthesis
MTLRQFLDILRARWRLATCVLLLCVAVSLALGWLLPKRYTSAAQVLVDLKNPDPVLGVLAPTQIVPGHMATQVDIVTSQRVSSGSSRTRGRWPSGARRPTDWGRSGISMRTCC